MSYEHDVTHRVTTMTPDLALAARGKPCSSLSQSRAQRRPEHAVPLRAPRRRAEQATHQEVRRRLRHALQGQAAAPTCGSQVSHGGHCLPSRPAQANARHRIVGLGSAGPWAPPRPDESAIRASLGAFPGSSAQLTTTATSTTPLLSRARTSQASSRRRRAGRRPRRSATARAALARGAVPSRSTSSP